MRLMGLMPIYQKTRTSIPHPEHKRYPYLLRDLNIAGPNHVWRADKVCCRKRLRGEGKSMVYDRYENFKNISIESYDLFIKELNSQWLSFFKPNYAIDSTCVKTFSNENFNISKDRFSFIHNGWTFDMLLNKKVEKKLFVIFSGFRLLTQQMPSFKRWSYFPFIPGSVLSIADPMFYKYDQLALGWYYGTQSEDLIEMCANIVKEIQRQLDVDDDNTTFFGSSGGGYTALQIARYFTGTTHIAINPQLQIKDFTYSKTFEAITGVSLTADDIFERNKTIDIVVRKTMNKFIIVQNINESHDCRLHFFPLLNAIGKTSLQLGLNRHEHLLSWIYNCYGGHNEQGDQLIFSFILNLVDIYKNNTHESPFFDFLYKNLSCQWRQRAWLENEKKSVEQKLSKLSDS